MFNIYGAIENIHRVKRWRAPVDGEIRGGNGHDDKKLVPELYFRPGRLGLLRLLQNRDINDA